MRLASNILAGVTNSIVLVMINLVTLPFYLRLLGMESYGLIGFYATLQAMSLIFDFGLAPTICREIAHDAEIGQQRRSASLLRTLGVIYVMLALIIAASIALAAPWIGSHWLQAKSLPENTVAHAVALMGVNLACRWPISLYHNALVGAHRLTWSAMTSISINIIAAVTTIVALKWGDRSIQTFFVVQALCGLVQGFTLRILAQKAVGERDAPLNFADLKRVLNFSSWMGGVALAGLIVSQFDKLALSRMVSLESFAHYTLAALLVSGLQIITTPVFNTLYPRFSALFARNDQPSLKYLYDQASRLCATALFALAFLIAFHSASILELWLGGTRVASDVAPIAAFLAVGSALNGVMFFPYCLQLAAGKPKLAFQIAIGLLIVMVPLVLFMVMRFGVIGGALAWAMVNAIYVVVGTWMTGKVVARFAGFAWVLRSVGIPLLATIVPSLLGAWTCRMLAIGPIGALGVAGCAAVVGIMLGVVGSFGQGQFRHFAEMAVGRATTSQRKVE